MGALLFTIKSVVLTSLIIAVLQITWNGQSLDHKLVKTVKAIGIHKAADSIAQGSLRLIKRNFNFMSGVNDGDYADSTSEMVNSAKLGFSKSEAYMAKKSQSAKRAIEKFRSELNKESSKESDQNEVLSEDLIFED